MKLSELIAAIGDDKIEMQNLQRDHVSLDNGKRGATIKFATSPVIVRDMMEADLVGRKPKKIGLVIWIDSEKADQLLSNENKQTSIL